MDKNQWLDPQPWERDVDAPGLSLGAAGQFDDTHLFAPCVALENERYYMWYSGSRGEVDLRVFALGLATSDDGLHFTRHPASPVCTLADGSHSILTPTLVRHPDGSLRREAGKLCMFFSSTDFPSGDKRHTLHAMTQRRRALLGGALRAPIRKRLRPHPCFGKTTTTACGTPM